MKSELAIFDLAGGTVTTVLETADLVEAPNWAALLVNRNGRLYRVEPADPGFVEIDTGFARKINNDHGISPDGTMLVISDSTKHGSSTIYTLPISGGTPVRVTKKAPSYWHGWSPDGRTLAYVGKRGDTFQVYTCPTEGGAEFQVTRNFDHCDGPDYTPDGQWIWFNGQKDSSVDLWRVHPEGSDVQKMTDDERVNWFPHPSPDGRHVLYLAYEPGVTGHPRHKDVELRLLPAAGGEPRVLLGLLGGQGTINVPCWAPDGRRFAFVRYFHE